MRTRLLSLLFSALALGAGAAQAAPLVFTTGLSGAAEFPPNNSPATGSSVVAYDPDARTLSVSIDFTGLLAPSTVAHIHCCVDAPGTAIPATTTPSFPGFPAGVTEGSYEAVFDLTLASSFNPAFIDLAGSVAQAEAMFAAGLMAGQAYVNVHSALFTAGEIRGFLNALPEPASVSLLAAGLLGLGLSRRPRRAEAIR